MWQSSKQSKRPDDHCCLRAPATGKPTTGAAAIPAGAQGLAGYISNKPAGTVLVLVALALSLAGNQ